MGKRIVKSLIVGIMMAMMALYPTPVWPATVTNERPPDKTKVYNDENRTFEVSVEQGNQGNSPVEARAYLRVPIPGHHFNYLIEEANLGNLPYLPLTYNNSTVVSGGGSGDIGFKGGRATGGGNSVWIENNKSDSTVMALIHSNQNIKLTATDKKMDVFGKLTACSNIDEDLPAKIMLGPTAGSDLGYAQSTKNLGDAGKLDLDPVNPPDLTAFRPDTPELPTVPTVPYFAQEEGTPNLGYHNFAWYNTNKTHTLPATISGTYTLSGIGVRSGNLTINDNAVILGHGAIVASGNIHVKRGAKLIFRPDPECPALYADGNITLDFYDKEIKIIPGAVYAYNYFKVQDNEAGLQIQGDLVTNFTNNEGVHCQEVRIEGKLIAPAGISFGHLKRLVLKDDVYIDGSSGFLSISMSENGRAYLNGNVYLRTGNLKIDTSYNGTQVFINGDLNLNYGDTANCKVEIKASRIIQGSDSRIMIRGGPTDTPLNFYLNPPYRETLFTGQIHISASSSRYAGLSLSGNAEDVHSFRGATIKLMGSFNMPNLASVKMLNTNLHLGAGQCRDDYPGFYARDAEDATLEVVGGEWRIRGDFQCKKGPKEIIFDNTNIYVSKHPDKTGWFGKATVCLINSPETTNKVAFQHAKLYTEGIIQFEVKGSLELYGDFYAAQISDGSHPTWMTDTMTIRGNMWVYKDGLHNPLIELKAENMKVLNAEFATGGDYTGSNGDIYLLDDNGTGYFYGKAQGNQIKLKGFKQVFQKGYNSLISDDGYVLMQGAKYMGLGEYTEVSGYAHSEKGRYTIPSTPPSTVDCGIVLEGPLKIKSDAVLESEDDFYTSGDVVWEDEATSRQEYVRPATIPTDIVAPYLKPALKEKEINKYALSSITDAIVPSWTPDYPEDISSYVSKAGLGPPKDGVVFATGKSLNDYVDNVNVRRRDGHHNRYEILGNLVLDAVTIAPFNKSRNEYYNIYIYPGARITGCGTLVTGGIINIIEGSPTPIIAFSGHQDVQGLAFYIGNYNDDDSAEWRINGSDTPFIINGHIYMRNGDSKGKLIVEGKGAYNPNFKIIFNGHIRCNEEGDFELSDKGNGNFIFNDLVYVKDEFGTISGTSGGMQSIVLNGDLVCNDKIMIKTTSNTIGTEINGNIYMSGNNFVTIVADDNDTSIYINGDIYTTLGVKAGVCLGPGNVHLKGSIYGAGLGHNSHGQGGWHDDLQGKFTQYPQSRVIVDKIEFGGDGATHPLTRTPDAVLIQGEMHTPGDSTISFLANDMGGSYEYKFDGAIVSCPYPGEDGGELTFNNVGQKIIIKDSILCAGDRLGFHDDTAPNGFERLTIEGSELISPHTNVRMGICSGGTGTMTNSAIYTKGDFAFGPYTGTPLGKSFTVSESSVYASGSITLRCNDITITNSTLWGSRVNHEGNSETEGEINNLTIEDTIIRAYTDRKNGVQLKGTNSINLIDVDIKSNDVIKLESKKSDGNDKFRGMAHAQKEVELRGFGIIEDMRDETPGGPSLYKDFFTSDMPQLDLLDISGTFKYNWKGWGKDKNSTTALASSSWEYDVFADRPDSIKVKSDLKYDTGTRQISKWVGYATYLGPYGTAAAMTNGAYWSGLTNNKVYDGALQPDSPLRTANGAPTIYARSAYRDLTEMKWIRTDADPDRASNMSVDYGGRGNYHWGTGTAAENWGNGLCHYEWWSMELPYDGAETDVTYDFSAADGTATLSNILDPDGSYTVNDDDLQGPMFNGLVTMVDPTNQPISTNAGTVINANVSHIDLTVTRVSDPGNAVDDDLTGFNGVNRVDVQFAVNGAFTAPVYGVFTATEVLSAGNSNNDGTWTVRIPQFAYYRFRPTDPVFIRVVAWDQDNEDGLPNLALNADRNLGVGDVFGPFSIVKSNLTIRAVTQDGKPMTYIVTPPYDADPGPGEDWRVDIIKRIEGQ